MTLRIRLHVWNESRTSSAITYTGPHILFKDVFGDIAFTQSIQLAICLKQSKKYGLCCIYNCPTCHPSRSSHRDLRSGKCVSRSGVWVPQTMRKCQSVGTYRVQSPHRGRSQGSPPGQPGELMGHFICNNGHLKKWVTWDKWGILKW